MPLLTDYRKIFYYSSSVEVEDWSEDINKCNRNTIIYEEIFKLNEDNSFSENKLVALLDMIQNKDYLSIMNKQENQINIIGVITELVIGFVANHQKKVSANDSLLGKNI